MSKFLILLSIFTVSASCKIFGQGTPMQIDRPGQKNSPFIVLPHYIQIESEFKVESVSGEIREISHPSVLWKYGLNKLVEFRMITELVTVQGLNNSVWGINPVTVGFKSNISRGEGIIPYTSFIGHITTAKIGSKEFQTSYIAPSFRFTMQNDLSEKISLTYNLGAEWDGNTSEQTYIYTLTAGFPLSVKINAFLEIYGYAPRDHKANHRIDGGITYPINNDFIADFSYGFGLTKNASKNFFSIGPSYRFKVIN